MTYIVSIDQGTTSTRAIVFDARGTVVASGQFEHRQHFPEPGWVEHDPLEIWENVREAVGFAMAKASVTRHDVAAVGITNQRETAVVWDPATGEPAYNAVVWQDTRTQPAIDELTERHGRDAFVQTTGLPLDAYFSASKFRWILDHVEDGQARAERGELLCGTIDSWVLWNLTGGPQGGVHATDVTNASRTLLMDLRTRDWSDEMLEVFGLPRACLPEIRRSSDAFGRAAQSSLLREVPITGVLGDQQAATFGQAAFREGESKNTYGTGNFVLLNTGGEPVFSDNGLITTVAYELDSGELAYALEGSIAVTGSLVQWLRDSLGIIASAAEVETLARRVDDAGGVVLVPAFSGLLAPHWRPDARGALLGITRFTTHDHIARAALEAVAWQSREVLDAMVADTGVPLTELKVDGGMVVNDLLMQVQADALGVPVVRPEVSETTALGAAYAAGLAVGFWSGLDELRELWREGRRWEPALGEEQREAELAQWRKGVDRSLGWVSSPYPPTPADVRLSARTSLPTRSPADRR
ncbi:glycerol kinase GlpK [Demequina sp. NBRC 110056]|uniref:glycerol kinase GlpK n=1 Tax=Demequina sp. NBRC 110056 TaxID=1570345 RepID=UPI000A01B568|nr:glycerol kinase GlpK [Demequina sp. NBRC 110056]